MYSNGDFFAQTVHMKTQLEIILIQIDLFMTQLV